jgi:hypothetical protein
MAVDSAFQRHVVLCLAFKSDLSALSLIYHRNGAAAFLLYVLVIAPEQSGSGRGRCFPGNPSGTFRIPLFSCPSFPAPRAHEQSQNRYTRA